MRSCCPLAALVFAVSVLAVKAWPAIQVNGWYFLYGRNWTYGNGYGAVVHTNGVAHPQGAQFGAWAIIWGTLVSSLIAIVIAVPLSVGAAFALTERMPTWISKPLGLTIEILAGIPSVVIGLWGILTFGPWLAKNVFPVIANNVPDVPVLRYFKQPVGGGEGLLAAGIVLALMIVPIITSTTRDLFQQVPPLPKEGASALGMTDWEVANKVTLPWVRSGIIGATVLGLGRALGETIAIAMIGGASLHIPPTIYLPFTTVAATILTQLDGALTDGTGLRRGHPGRAGARAGRDIGRGQPPGPHDHQADRSHGRTGGRRLMANTLAGGATTRRRRVSTITWRGLTYLALVLIMAPAAWLLLGVITRAWSHWQWSVLWTQLTPTGGGLRDQILGTLILMVGVFIVAGTIGVMAGIHLAEFSQPKKVGGRLGGPLRTASDILSGFPSIVLGYVGYVALVVGLHWGFSLRSALIILSIMVIPYIAKTTENSMRQVPTGYREGAAALGMSEGYGLRKVVLKSALPGITTGLLLALAIACGETAPLHLHGRVLQHPAALAHARAVPLPDLCRLHLLQRPVGAEALPLLRRRADPRGHRAPPPGGQPHHRGPHPAPLRERPHGARADPRPPGTRATRRRRHRRREPRAAASSTGDRLATTQSAAPPKVGADARQLGGGRHVERRT